MFRVTRLERTAQSKSKMELRPGLEEMHYGKWEDKTVEFVKEHYWDDYIHWLTGTCLEPADWR